MINRLYGVDGCRGGWIVAEANHKLDNLSFRITEDLNSLFAKARPRCVIAIDIPIGLPINEPRLCDKEARKLLGWPRRNSVFSPPGRGAVNAGTYRQALGRNRKILGTGISKQAFCIMAKIREVDALMDRDRRILAPAGLPAEGEITEVVVEAVTIDTKNASTWRCP